MFSEKQTQVVASRQVETTFLCTMMHFLVDGICLCCLYMIAYWLDGFMLIAMITTYNVLAFLTQPFTGICADRWERRHWILLCSNMLLILAVVVVIWISAIGVSQAHSVLVFVMAAMLGIGNSLFHVWGGKETAVKTSNDIRAMGVFVSSGALGLTLGLLYSSWPLLYVFLLTYSLLSVVYVLRDNVAVRSFHVVAAETDIRRRWPLGLAILALAALMAFVVFRSFVGQDLSSVLGKERWMVLAVGALSMAGKMAGGFISKWLGTVSTLVMALIAVALCLWCKDFGMAVPLLGLFLINCTMPITLYWANGVLEGKEGLAFGLLAAALVPGYLLALL